MKKPKIISLVLDNSDFETREVLLMSLFSGFASLLIIYSINQGALAASYENISFEYLIVFVIGMVLYVVSMIYIYNEITEKFDDALENKRLSILDKIRRAEFYDLDRIGSSIIYSRITQEIETISNVAYSFGYILVAASVTFFACAYIIYISFIAFVLYSVVLYLACDYFFKKQKKVDELMRIANAETIKLFEAMQHIIMGFKEIKMNYLRNQEIYDDLEKISEREKALKKEAKKVQNENMVFANYWHYTKLAILIFLLPRLIPNYAENIVEIYAIMLFLMEPLYSSISFVPILGTVNLAVENLEKLEETFDKTIKLEKPTPCKDFQKITFDKVYFSYKDVKKEKDALFPTGPINLEINRGETVFVIGGNGSGKSTFLKLLTSLYYSESGYVRINNTIITPQNSSNYRELFSIIFGDFHLFNKLYGIPQIDKEIVDQLLKTFELHNKTTFEDGIFTQTNLSTGQRKRLALIIALLEERPIYIFDEWAAEQDPKFRKYFYEKFIPMMKNKGKTIIAVTHDDHYFNLADKVIKFSEGKIINEHQ